MDRFNRTEILLGKEQLSKLRESHVTVCGLGGVGSYAMEALARAGIGQIRIVDFDVVSKSNMNRQLLALSSTVGMCKTDVAYNRIKDINPECRVEVINQKIDEFSEDKVLSEPCHVLIDAIDMLSCKVHLIANAVERNIHVISSMGAGGRMNADTIYTCDISETHTCPLARFVRRKLHRRNIQSGIRCVFSPEVPVNKSSDGKMPMGTISYVTAIFGLKAAGEAINYILGC